MRRWTVAVGAVVLAMVATTASAKIFTYEAKLATPVATAGTMRAGVFNWKCDGDTCTLNAPWEKPAVGQCRALAKQVGRITSYGHDEIVLDAEQLEECNAAAAAAP
jgi:hypothetical protein